MTIQPLNPNLILASQHAQDQLRQLEADRLMAEDRIARALEFTNLAIEALCETIDHPEANVAEARAYAVQAMYILRGNRQ